jgi:hypothetical protein
MAHDHVESHAFLFAFLNIMVLSPQSETVILSKNYTDLRVCRIFLIVNVGTTPFICSLCNSGQNKVAL